MSKRPVAAFTDSTKDKTPSKSDEPKGRSHRSVRAFGNLAEASMGGLQQDHGRDSKDSRQFAHPSEVMTDGGNSSGRTLKAVDPYFAANFQGKSGQPDNQSTNRGPGRT